MGKLGTAGGKESGLQTGSSFQTPQQHGQEPSRGWTLASRPPSPARVSCPMFHSSWGQLQAPSHSGLLKTRTGSGERCSTNTQNTGEKPHPLSSPRRIAGGIMGSEQRPPSPTLTPQQDMPQRTPAPEKCGSGSHCWGPRLCQWSLRPEAPGPVRIFTATRSGGLGTSARSPERGGREAHSPAITWKAPGETMPPELPPLS